MMWKLLLAAAMLMILAAPAIANGHPDDSSQPEARGNPGIENAGLQQADNARELAQQRIQKTGTGAETGLEQRDDETRGRTDALERAREASGGLGSDGSGNAAERKIPEAARDAIMNRDAFARLGTEQMEKFRKLDDRKLERLSELREDDIEKLKGIAPDRLRVIAEVRKEHIEKLDTENVEKLAKLDRARVRMLSELMPEEAEKRLEKIRIIKADEEFRFRPLTLEQAQRSARALEQLKQNEAMLRERYEERRELLLAIRETVQECRADPGAENCANADEEAIERAKEHALSSAERVLNHMGKVRERVVSAQDLQEEEAAARIERVDALIAEVEGITAEIEAAASKEELNEAVRKLKAAVAKVKETSNAQARTLVRARIIGAMHSTEVIEKRLECSLESVEDKSAIEEKLSGYAALMETARERIELAKESNSHEESKELVKEAHETARQARETLREIRQEIIDAGGAICEGEQEIPIEEEE